MTDKPLLRIGAFSRASSFSVKTLRAYHEQGLLMPAEVDSSTGYRAYSVAQLLDAAIIRRLRQLDVPLAAIREVLDARDPAVTRKVLADHAAVVEERTTWRTPTGTLGRRSRRMLNLPSCQCASCAGA